MSNNITIILLLLASKGTSIQLHVYGEAEIVFEFHINQAVGSVIWISAFQILCNKLVIDEFRTKVTIAKQEMKQRTSNDVITTLDLTNYWSNPTLLRFLLKTIKAQGDGRLWLFSSWAIDKLKIINSRKICKG